ncbi:Hypothetical_protein [Hexamita inflata]|uniref:Hypothetical_protein n=1 Tax=Hexamita inflata TaxID=28002 RepID=A0ABP1HC04_9EUKA
MRLARGQRQLFGTGVMKASGGHKLVVGVKLFQIFKASSEFTFLLIQLWIDTTRLTASRCLFLLSAESSASIHASGPAVIQLTTESLTLIRSMLFLIFREHESKCKTYLRFEMMHAETQQRFFSQYPVPSFLLMQSCCISTQ